MPVKQAAQACLQNCMSSLTTRPCTLTTQPSVRECRQVVLLKLYLVELLADGTLQVQLPTQMSGGLQPGDGKTGGAPCS